MKYGIDVLLELNHPLTKGKIGLITNEAAVNSEGKKSRLAMLEAGIQIIRLFSPEHGLSVKGADGFRQGDTVDTLTRLPVISLYNDKLAPDQTDLQDLDAVFFDIPDIGCRFYTYLWTMTYAMESCAKAGIPFVVLDRPNPTGLDLRLAEGPMLDEESCSSFIGRWNIPVRHCCTLGELALYFSAMKIPDLQIQVIPVGNYNRGKHEMKFIPTSPAIQNISAAVCYPGTGLLEGVNINEGRGTEWSFRIAAAPWLNTEKLLQHFETKPMPGLIFSSCNFTAKAAPYEHEFCRGLLWNITDQQLFHPVSAGWKLLQLIHHFHPDVFTSRLYQTMVNPSGEQHLDKLIGVKNAFSILTSGQDLNFDVADIWEKKITPFKLYR